MTLTRSLTFLKPKFSDGGHQKNVPMIFLENTSKEAGSYNLIALRQNDLVVSKELKGRLGYKQVAVDLELSVDDFRSWGSFSHIPVHSARGLSEFLPQRRFTTEADFYAQDVSVDFYIVRGFLSPNGRDVTSCIPQKSVLYAVAHQQKIALHPRLIQIHGENKCRDPLEGTFFEPKKSTKSNYVYTLDGVLGFETTRKLFHPSRRSLAIYFVEKKSLDYFLDLFLDDR